MAGSRTHNPYADLELSEDVVLFDFPRFDRLIATHGVQLVHYKAVNCPIGVTDEFDVHAHADHTECSNGVLYREAGTLTAVLQNNQSMAVFDDIGVMEGSTIQATLARYYDDSNKEVNVQPYDRLYMKDRVVMSNMKQLFEHNQTGVDKLQYPVIEVEFLMDSRGKEYREGHDFVVENGLLRWAGQNQPGYDPSINKGSICSIRYSYRAYWYVKNLLHEVRVGKQIDETTGEINLLRCPQSLILEREFVFENERNNPESSPKKDPRAVRSPRKASLGPR